MKLMMARALVFLVEVILWAITNTLPGKSVLSLAMLGIRYSFNATELQSFNKSLK